jgi:hypothetical protein
VVLLVRIELTTSPLPRASTAAINQLLSVWFSPHHPFASRKFPKFEDKFTLGQPSISNSGCFDCGSSTSESPAVLATA